MKMLNFIRFSIVLAGIIFSICRCPVYSSAQSVATNPISTNVALRGMASDGADKQLYFVTTLITAQSPDGRISRGTGFLFDHEMDTNHHMIFVVTCRHVVDGFASAHLSLLQDANNTPNLGHEFGIDIQDLQQMVFYNTNSTIDIAILPLGPILIKEFISKTTYFSLRLTGD